MTGNNPSSTQAFACINLNDRQRALSSSGGIFPLLAERIISSGGIVYAACYDQDLNVVHKRIVSLSDIPEAQGSKYVCSLLGDSFKAVAKDIAQDKVVLFCGTPCQCAGLRSFLSLSGGNTEKLVLVDFVCHGVPGYAAWRAYLQSLRDKGFDIVSLNMRDKSSGWSRSNYSWKLVAKDGGHMLVHRSHVSFMKGMLANLYCRPSCYRCAFKGIERMTDITLGDYWGVWRLQPEMDDDKGTSIVLVHSEKGQRLFGGVSEEMKYSPADINGAAEANVCMVRSCSDNPKRQEFYNRLFAGDRFEKIIDDLTRVSIMEKAEQKIKRKVKKLFRKV